VYGEWLKNDKKKEIMKGKIIQIDSLVGKT